jgi:hypothetical protein
MKQNWYAKRAGNDTQGIIIDEETGRTVAVTYDHKDTALLAAAPVLLNACRLVEEAWAGSGDMVGAVDACLLAIAKAKEE